MFKVVDLFILVFNISKFLCLKLLELDILMHNACVYTVLEVLLI